MKKKIINILGVMAAGIGLVTVLAFIALVPGKTKSNFKRVIKSTPLIELNKIKKGNDIYDIAGITNSSLFFITKDASRIYSTNYNLEKTGAVELKIPTNMDILSNFNCIIDSPIINIFAGNIPGLIRVQIDSPSKFYKINGTVFTRATKINSNSFVLRMFDGFDQIFVKTNIMTGQVIKEKNVSDKIGDAGLSTDGELSYDEMSKYLIFTPFYKNEIYCLDTNLNLINKIIAFDNGNSQNISTSKNENNPILTSTAPKRIINASTSVNDGYLFVHSVAKSEAEATKTFRDNSIIDVYNLSEGKYSFSFYVPNHDGEAMIKFRVIKDILVVFYKKSILSYSLSNLIIK